MEIPPAIAAIAPDGKLSLAQRRRFMIDFCRRRIRPGTGSGPEFLARRTAMNPWPDLRPILQGISWVIVGAVATRAYMPERATQDLNILIHADDDAIVRERLELAGYHQFTPLTAPPGFQVYSPKGVDVKVILGKHLWLKKALAHPRQDPAGYPVLDLPYLVLMKIESSRTHDLGDLATLLGLALEDELARVRAATARYAPDEAQDVESFIYLGQVEMGKIEKIE